MPLTIKRLEEIANMDVDKARAEYRARARELLRLNDPHYVLDNDVLIDAIATEMMTVRAQTIDDYLLSDQE